MISPSAVFALANSIYSSADFYGIESYRIVGLKLTNCLQIFDLSSQPSPFLRNKIVEMQNQLLERYYNSDHFHQTGELLGDL